MKHLLIIAFSLCIAAISLEGQETVPSPFLELKPRQPNWRIDVIKTGSSGVPQIVVFYEPTLEGERPVKQVLFYENGRIQVETDVTAVQENSPAAKEWGSPIVPHG